MDKALYENVSEHHNSNTTLRSFSLTTWIIDISGWDPDPTEWQSTLNLFSQEIQDKIRFYHHRMDAKRSLVGKLMVHSFIFSSYSIPWNEITFSTNSFGKPYLANQLPDGQKFNFNITHDGDMVACIFSQESWIHKRTEGVETKWGVKGEEEISKTHEVGIDIMQVKAPTGLENEQDFLEFMKDNLSDQEKKMIDQINFLQDSKSSLLPYYLLQIWTIKESIIKALGYGLTLELESISLNRLIPQVKMELDQFHRSTTHVDNQNNQTQRLNSMALPFRSDLIILINNNQDLDWKFWNATWTSSNNSRYIFSVAVKFFLPHLIPTNELFLKLEFKSISDLITPQKS